MIKDKNVKVIRISIGPDSMGWLQRGVQHVCAEGA